MFLSTIHAIVLYQHTILNNTDTKVNLLFLLYD